ncbi:MAG: hypothetical protein DCC71_25035, partial [Proteobacteria bacterium]
MIEALAQDVLDAMADAVAVVDASGRVIAANRRFVAAMGSVAALPERLEQPAAFLDVLRLASRSRGTTYGTFRLRGAESERFRCEASLVRPRGDGDALLLVRLVPHATAAQRFVELTRRVHELAAEVARRQRVEEELRRQRSWLEVTLTSIGDAVIATDAHGAVAFMNPVAERLTGWTQAEAAGRPLSEVFRIVHEETREPVESPVERVLAEGVVVGLANHTLLIRRDGSELAIDDSAAPIRNGSGRVQGVVLVFHDVTDQRALSRELHERAVALAEADRRKDEFLAMLAHELRNPLAPMQTGLELLRHGDPQQVEWAQAILERQLRHMARLVDDLLDVSRLTRGKLALQVEPVDLTALVRSATDPCRSFLDARGHQLALRLPSEPLPALADPVRIEQVVMNLLHNAGKFTPPGGTIEVTLRRVGDAAELAVRDDGAGIAAEALASIFELFAQGDQSIARAQGGLGIGLTLVREIVELHFGEVKAASAGPGCGSTFTVRLPLARAAAAPAERAPAATRA